MPTKTIKHVFLIIALFTLPISAFSEYKTKSLLPANDYKCVSDEVGGFNHSKEGHKLTRFNGQEEFFITHISNIPDDAILEMQKQSGVKDRSIDESRSILEEGMIEQDASEYGILETKSFFIRAPHQDPKSFNTYIGLTSNQCSSYQSEKFNSKSIICFTNNDITSFFLDLITMRFSYSYLGTWHNEVENNYYGDSSVFAFGACKKYFR